MKAIILGIVQGLTEFLPVSSSGHLVLGQHLFGFTEPEILFDVILHTGTLAAVCIVFFRELTSLIFELASLPQNLFKYGLKRLWRDRPHFRMMMLIIIGSIPTGIMGVFFQDFFKSLFTSTLAVGLALIFTGTILFFTRFVQHQGRSLSGFRPSNAFMIGIAQGLAITPGVSRSGMTISTAMFLGVDRELAARYSFLLSIPAILGALVLELNDASSGSFTAFDLGAGFIAALVSGLIALLILLKLVKGGKLHYFAYYCWTIGIATAAISIWGG